ncbi:MAG: phage major capsid protein [Lachnospiraceae bacterium]|nr:phage major capsid protein [Lachnospiraceae bacterium]
MALRALMLNKKIQSKRAELEKLREAAGELKKREAELEAAVEEAATEEEQKAVEEEIDNLDADKKENEKETERLEGELKDLEAELEEATNSPVEGRSSTAGENRENRTGGTGNMLIRRGFFEGRTVEERDAMVSMSEVKEFISQIRSMKGQSRAVSGAELTIPNVMLEMIRDNLNKYSKLIKHIRLKPVKGTSRQNIAGTIPEGIWMEAMDSLKELSIGFNQVEMDGYKVGGFIPVPNAILEDSDINLVSEIMEALAQAIGIAVDKAILYGTGKKMPTGIVTRLAQKTKPDTWGKKAPAWKDLSSANIKKLNISSKTGAEFFAALIKGLGVVKENYSDGKKVWCMNSNTKMELLAKAVTFNAAGTIVASLNDEMPIIGGRIETFDFMQDGDIVGGFASLYVLAERKGGTFSASEHVKFIEDLTLYKGTARYDGMPVIGEGFVAANIGSTAPLTTVPFSGQEAETQAESETENE